MMSMRRLWVRRSNCSRLSLYLWTARRIVTISVLVGRGMGPETFASVRLAASTMVSAALSISVDQLMIVSLETDADHVLVACHGVFFSFFVRFAAALGTALPAYGRNLEFPVHTTVRIRPRPKNKPALFKPVDPPSMRYTRVPDRFLPARSCIRTKAGRRTYSTEVTSLSRRAISRFIAVRIRVPYTRA